MRSTKENGRADYEMDSGLNSGLMVRSTLDNGKTTKLTVKENLRTQTVIVMKAIGQMIKRQDGVFSGIRMVLIMMASGVKTNNMVKV